MKSTAFVSRRRKTIPFVFFFASVKQTHKTNITVRKTIKFDLLNIFKLVVE